MALLKMTGHVGGTYAGRGWPAPGGTVEVGDQNVIDELVRGRLAVVVPEPVIETVDVIPPENTAKRTAKPKARRSSRPAKEG